MTCDTYVILMINDLCYGFTIIDMKFFVVFFLFLLESIPYVDS